MHDDIKFKIRKINGYRQFHIWYEIVILWRILYLIDGRSLFPGANQFELTSE